MRFFLRSALVAVERALPSSRVGFCVVLLLSLLISNVAHAGNATWDTTGSSWYTPGNWVGNAFPGTQGVAAVNHDIATFTSSATGTTFGINMNSGNSLNLGAISLDSTRTTAFSLGNNSGSAAGSLRLYGATVNLVPNVIFRNAGSGDATLQFQQSSNMPMDVVLGNSTTNLVSLDSSGNLSITSNISGSGNKLALNSASSGSLRLYGSNTYDGGTDIGGSSTGALRIEAVGALPTSGQVTVSTGGRLTFAIAGTHGGISQGLVLNPNQTTNAALDIASGANVTWQGTYSINADSRIDTAGASGNLTLSGNGTGSGMIVKTGDGSLVLSGAANNLTGATQISSGTVTVASGSGLGTGALTLTQASSKDTTVILNNATQSVGNLSSVWNQASGTRTQTLKLNGTAFSVNQASDATFGTGNVSTLVSTITGSGSFTKGGSAKLTLSSNNTYTGSTIVSGGTLALSGSGSNNISSSSTIQVNSSATLDVTGLSSGSLNLAATQTLKGGGTVRGGVNAPSGSNVAAGSSVGVLTFAGAGNITLNSGAVVEMELGSDATPGSTYDQIVVDHTSTKTLSPNSATLRLIGVSGITTGQPYTIITTANSGAIAGSSYFKNDDLAGTLMDSEATTYTQNGLSFTINYESNFVAVTFSTVPEPSAAFLLGLPLLLHRRKRARAGLSGRA